MGLCGESLEHREDHGIISTSETPADCSELDDELAKKGRMMIQLKQFLCTIWGGGSREKEELVSLIPASIGTSHFCKRELI